MWLRRRLWSVIVRSTKCVSVEAIKQINANILSWDSYSSYLKSILLYFFFFFFFLLFHEFFSFLLTWGIMAAKMSKSTSSSTFVNIFCNFYRLLLMFPSKFVKGFLKVSLSNYCWIFYRFVNKDPYKCTHFKIITLCSVFVSFFI